MYLSKELKIEEILNNNEQLITKVKGHSMYSFLLEESDIVVIENIKTLKKNDCILFKRNNGEFILHRIVKNKNGCFLVSGDNQLFLEKVFNEQILGKLVYCFRNGKKRDLKGLKYRFYLLFLPIKRFCKKILRKVKINKKGKTS